MAGADGLEPSKMQESKSCALPTWRCPNILASSGLHTFLTHCVSNHSGEHPFAFALLSLIASIKRDLTGIELINLNSLEGFKSRRIYLCPKAGLEPAIALVLGKCLNHLNYSGSKNCCSRLMVRLARLERATPCLKGKCLSTN